MIFHENPKISSPWGWPWCRLNFSPEIFQKLSRSESESSQSKLGLDGRKLKTTDRILRTDQKREKSEPKKSAQILTQVAPTTIEQYYFPRRKQAFKNRLYKPYYYFQLSWSTERENSEPNRISPLNNPTCECCKWLRQNFEHCAQCRTQMDFDGPEPSWNQFLC